MTHQLRLRAGIALAAAITALVAGMGVAAQVTSDSHVLAIHCSGQHFPAAAAGRPTTAAATDRGGAGSPA
jgi:hypothetical protein